MSTDEETEGDAHSSPQQSIRVDTKESLESLSLADVLVERLSNHLENAVLPNVFANQLEALFAKQLEDLTTSLREVLETKYSPRTLPGIKIEQYTSPRDIMAKKQASYLRPGKPIEKSASFGSSWSASEGDGRSSQCSRDSFASSCFAPPGCLEPGAPQGPAPYSSEREFETMGSFAPNRTSEQSNLPVRIASSSGIQVPKRQRERAMSTVAGLHSHLSGFLLAELKGRTPANAEDSPSSGSPHSTPGASMTPSELSLYVPASDGEGAEMGKSPSLNSKRSSNRASPIMPTVPERSSSASSHFSDLSQLTQLTHQGHSEGGKDGHRRSDHMHALRKKATEECLTDLEGRVAFSCDYLWIPLRTCGFVPWKDLSDAPNRLKYALCLSHQWLLLAIAVLGCVTSVLPFFDRPKLQSTGALCYGHSCLHLGLFCDVAIAFGSLFGLVSVAAYRGSPQLAQCLQLMGSYAFREDFEERWEELTRREVPVASLLWLVVVMERVRGTAMLQAVLDGRVDGLSILHTIAFAMSSLLLVVLTYLVLHISHGLASSVDAFCSSLINSGDLSQAIHRWNMVGAILREVCSSIQSCLFVLQATVLFTFMLGAVDFYLSDQSDESYGSLLFPHALLTFWISRVFFTAAAVTEKCARVPSLINACDFGVPFDEKRQYVVQYVEQSAAGFYVTDIRLTASMTVKFSYVCVLGLFTLATKIVADQ